MKFPLVGPPAKADVFLDEIAKELVGGQVPESKQVLGFEDTKEITSKPERVLAAVHKAYLSNPTAHASTFKCLMGINDDIIKE
eukprot:15168509-Ditylum_brightwellii.AAC.1